MEQLYATSHIHVQGSTELNFYVLSYILPTSIRQREWSSDNVTSDAFMLLKKVLESKHISSGPYCT